MAYRQGNYSFVIEPTYTPFTMQEMLAPLAMYKDVYEKSEEAYADLTDKADKFKYLSETLPEGSRARQIYEGYANELNSQAEDLANNGLNMGNRRALTNLKRRYQGEIGRLVEADTALKQEQALRRQMSAKDPSMLYAIDDLNIDSYLNGRTPNLYGISGTDLYTKAAAASQAMSKRQFSVNGESKTLGGYYYDYIQKMGYTPEDLRKFGDQISADFAAQVSVLPELQQAANQILEANGVTENFRDNPNNLRKAQQQVIRGLIDGAVYTESHNPQRDLGKLTKSEQMSFDLQKQGMDRQAAASGLFWNEKTKSYDYNPDKDPSMQKQIAVLEKRKELGIGTGSGSGKGGSSGGSGSSYYPINKDTIVLEWETEDQSDTPIGNIVDDDTFKGEKNKVLKTYDQLTAKQQEEVERAIGADVDKNLYEYWVTPHDGGWFSGKSNKVYIKPRVPKKANSSSDELITVENPDED